MSGKELKTHPLPECLAVSAAAIQYIFCGACQAIPLSTFQAFISTRGSCGHGIHAHMHKLVHGRQQGRVKCVDAGCVSTHMLMYTQVFMYTYIHIYMFFAGTYSFIYIIYAQTIYVHIYIYIYIYLYMCIYVQMYTA